MLVEQTLNDPRLQTLSPLGLSQARERMWTAYLEESGATEKYDGLSEDGKAEARRRFDSYLLQQKPEVFRAVREPEGVETTYAPVMDDMGNATGRREVNTTTPAQYRQIHDPKTEAFIQAYKEGKFNPSELDDRAYAEAAPFMRTVLSQQEYDNFISPLRERLQKRGIGPFTFSVNSIVRGAVPDFVEKAADNAGIAIATSRGEFAEQYQRAKDYEAWRVAYGDLDESLRTTGATAGLVGSGSALTSALGRFAMRAGPKSMSTLLGLGAIDYAYAERLPGFFAEGLKDPTAKALATTAEGMAIGAAGGLIAKAAKGGRAVKPAINTTLDVDAIQREFISERAARNEAAEKAGKLIKDSGGAIDSLLGPISTRLGNVAPELKFKFRNLEYNIHTKTFSYKSGVRDWFKEKKRRMRFNRKDREALDYALLNRDVDETNRLVGKYGLREQFDDVRKVLSDLLAEAQSVGYEAGYLEDYFPRSVKDAEGLQAVANRGGKWGIFDRAIKEEEKKVGRVLGLQERAGVIDSVVRGYGGQTRLGKPANLKERQINVVPKEWRKFYHDSDHALISYIDSIVNSVEKRRFFGKEAAPHNPKLHGTADAEFRMAGSIGEEITRLQSQGRISPLDQDAVIRLAQARINQKPGAELIRAAKGLTYAAIMGSQTSMITQIGDFAWAAYKDGVMNLPENAIRRRVKMEDLGFGNIAAEFGDPGKIQKMVNNLFGAVGLTAMDKLGKETLIEASFRRAEKIAQTPTSSGYKRLSRELVQMFGQEAPQVLNDLANGRVTAGTKFYLFNQVSDFQPVTMSEVPEQYLKNPNGRTLYMLKTFTLKQLDVYRREAFQEIAKGNVKRGMGNLIRLGALFAMFNATADEIKDLMLNRETDISDRVIDNVLRTAGVDKWMIYDLRRTQNPVLTPIKWLVPQVGIGENIGRDAYKILTDNYEDGFRTTQNIPLAGKLYYWWFGGGAERMAEEGKQRVPTR